MPKWGILHGDKTGAWVVVMIAQLVYRLLLPLEGPGSNPVIGNFSINIVKRTENTKIKLSNHRIPGIGGGALLAVVTADNNKKKEKIANSFVRNYRNFHRTRKILFGSV